ncbi:MAG: hypothetical protein L0Z50_28490, partial [Verrucomicrobiales bacterium]|nr:hypothetical protein [Verrucomicrobiales bacterium]
LPAREQKVWNSPWGKIGICVCYDLSYRRVTDAFVRQGARALIVPTMDVADWGERQHSLHARVAPMRAAEHRIPIFRLASSGISQHVDASGHELGRTPFPGQGEFLIGDLQLSGKPRLPFDHVFAPVCVAVTAVVIGWLLVRRFWRRLSSHPHRSEVLATTTHPMAKDLL